MEIIIEYCAACNFQPRASKVAEELRRRFNAEVRLVASARGAFEVIVDGRMVFSKKELGRFPEEGELFFLLAP